MSEFLQDVSATGMTIKVIASMTFPSGINISTFADDADPLDAPDIQIAEYAMDINGSLVLWRTPKPIEATINVLPDSLEDKNLAILAETNRVAKGKISVRDVITMIVVYANGKVVKLTNGALVSVPPVTGAASAGRLKSKAYKFVFQGK